jgi:hypothetical protein
MARILDIIYWLVVGSIAILSVLLYYYNSNLFLDSSLLLIAMILIREYEEQVNERKYFRH